MTASPGSSGMLLSFLQRQGDLSRTSILYYTSSYMLDTPYMECHDTLFGPFRIGDGGFMDRAETNGYETKDYYEAVRIAFMKSEYMRKPFDSPKGINNLNKDNKALWEFTYKIRYEEKKRVKVVSKSPDNLLVQWVPGGKTVTEILKEMGVKPRKL